MLQAAPRALCPHFPSARARSMGGFRFVESLQTSLQTSPVSGVVWHGPGCGTVAPSPEGISCSGRWERASGEATEDFPHWPQTTIFKLLHMFPFITSRTHLLGKEVTNKEKVPH